MGLGEIFLIYSYQAGAPMGLKRDYLSRSLAVSLSDQLDRSGFHPRYLQEIGSG